MGSAAWADSTANEEYAAGLRRRNSGHLAQATASFQRAFRADSSDPRIRLACATTAAHRERALALIASVTNDNSADDSVRAQAYSVRADIRCATGDWGRAAEDYARAYALSSRPADAYRLALARTAQGHTAQADSILTAVHKNGADERETAYHRGLVCMDKGDYTAALTQFRVALDGRSRDKTWEASAMAGQVVCAERLEYDNLATTYRRELARRYPGCLERKQFGSPPKNGADFGDAVARRPRKQQRNVKPVETPSAPSTDGERTYTIQLGSFADSTNAVRLHRGLQDRFTNARIVTAQVDGTTYHRVRLGVFPDKQAAERFAKDEVAEQGLSYSVVSE